MRASTRFRVTLISVFLIVGVGLWSPIFGDEAPKENWSRVYRDFHELVSHVQSDSTHNFFRRFMMIKDGQTIATIEVDPFAVQVLLEADAIFQPYREGVQTCVDRSRSEFHTGPTYSYEKFAWFFDSYVKTVLGALEPHDEHRANGVHERKVTSDRAVYAYTQLLTAYLNQKIEKYSDLENDAYSQSADRALAAAINEIGHRVFKVDLTVKFSRSELITKGLSSQPVLRDIASDTAGNELLPGLDPIQTLATDKGTEPACRIVLAPRATP